VDGGSAGRTNWAGNVTYRARTLHRPRSVDEAQSIVRSVHRLRPLGSRHSFNDIADTDGDQLTLTAMPRRFEIDPEAGTVTIDGGQRYGDVGASLDAAGFALHNLASLGHIEVAGACATGTHGSGQRNGSLATALSRVELIASDGELRTYERGDEGFPAAATALGALGVVTALTLRIEPTFAIAQRVYEDVPLDDALVGLDEILGSAYSVSLFWSWREPAIDQVWRKTRIGVDDEEPPDVLTRAHSATADRHPIRGLPVENCTPQLGIRGPWHERLPHFRLDHTSSAGEELQTEMFVDRRDAPAALEALLPLRARIAESVQVTEIRAIAADDFWLSPAYGRDSVAIHFTWRPLPATVIPTIDAIQRTLDPFEPRPHWGKLFTMRPADVRSRYPQLDRFVELARSLDPEGTFRNAFLDRYVFVGD
jgi:xylitol oxidase